MFFFPKAQLGARHDHEVRSHSVHAPLAGKPVGKDSVNLPEIAGVEVLGDGDSVEAIALRPGKLLRQVSWIERSVFGNLGVDVKIEQRRVEVGTEGNETTEIVSGLKTDETIVTQKIEPAPKTSGSPFGGGGPGMGRGMMGGFRGGR